MNEHIQRIDSQRLVSITDLKKNPSAVIAAAQDGPVAVLNHNRVTAYIIKPEVYQDMLDRLEDLEDIATVLERQHDATIAVSIDDLAKL
ncbi:type II toxin-antitoxin system Phd/YefM family antitoxin [Devosia sp. FKR38]|uniref:type II toxin-antitoxin system Phd/YefM family antitoxin n=1 Tax=Devosia sp. FKR38 TaxID=2562312 RepID=UPI0010C01CE8|nr:type II toxin-antitoxin system Phd/YefM family antitoxin [Devosia sp. FKR38]